jgi:hypothetical protein
MAGRSDDIVAIGGRYYRWRAGRDLTYQHHQLGGELYGDNYTGYVAKPTMAFIVEVADASEYRSVLVCA